MTDLAFEIQESIRKALPAHLSDQLQQVLKEGSAAKASLDNLLKISAEKTAEIVKLSAMVIDQNTVKNREDAVKKREDEVQKRENRAEINEYKVTVMNERINDVKEIVRCVFANNKFKYQSMGTESNYSNNQSNNSSISKTIETEGD